MKFIIPPSAVPDDVQQIRISVQDIASGPFVLPSHCHPINCFYCILNIRLNISLRKIVKNLNIFSFAPSTGTPYQFYFLDRIISIFSLGSVYGIIKVSEFSICLSHGEGRISSSLQHLELNVELKISEAQTPPSIEAKF